MSEIAKWYVVHTYSGYENKVAATILKTVENRHLEDLFFDIRVPMENVPRSGTTVRKKKWNARCSPVMSSSRWS